MCLLCGCFQISKFSRVELLIYEFVLEMGRKAKFDVREKRGPGRKAKKQKDPVALTQGYYLTLSCVHISVKLRLPCVFFSLN